MTFSVGAEKDCPAIATLANSAYRGESSKKGWTTEAHLLGGQRTDPDKILEMMKAPGACFLLCRDEKNNLMASVYLEEKDHGICYLGMLSVSPTLQASGIGRAMLAESEKTAREKFFSSRMEMTVITVRQELIDWYLRRGYHRTGRIVEFPMHDERFGVPLVGFLEMEVLAKDL